MYKKYVFLIAILLQSLKPTYAVFDDDYYIQLAEWEAQQHRPPRPPTMGQRELFKVLGASMALSLGSLCLSAGSLQNFDPYGEMTATQGLGLFLPMVGAALYVMARELSSIPKPLEFDERPQFVTEVENPCFVCGEEYVKPEDAPLYKSPACTHHHVAHKDCWKRWHPFRPTCPYCETHVQTVQRLQLKENN